MTRRVRGGPGLWRRWRQVHGGVGNPNAREQLSSEEEGYGAIRAIDPLTGDRKWEFKITDFTDAGILTTASDLLFSGGRERYFYALDARTGVLLWRFSVSGQVQSGPTSALAKNGPLLLSRDDPA